LSGGNIDLIDELLAPDYTNRVWASPIVMASRP